jgi:hypothetical protein
LAAVTLLERNGTPISRQSWPVICAACVYSGVPKAGASFVDVEVKPPYITGTPGRTIWVSVMPASASACCCERAGKRHRTHRAASVNGVMTLTWPCSAGDQALRHRLIKLQASWC